MLLFIFLFSALMSDVYAQVNIETSPVWQNTDLEWTCKIELADINNDGYPDLIAANADLGVWNDVNVKIYQNTTDPNNPFPSTASQEILIPNNSGSWNLALGDYDNDGDLDLAVGNQKYKNDLIYRNNNGTFEYDPVWTSSDASVSHGLDWVDYDNDGDLDLSVTAAYSGVKIYENVDNVISTTRIWESDIKLDFQDVDWSDFDNDGDLDLAITNHYAKPPGGIYFFENDNGVLPTAQTWQSTYDSSEDLVSLKRPIRLKWADINNDGFPELGFGSISGPTTIFINNNGELSESQIWQAADSGDAGDGDIRFCDVDNDGLVNDSIIFSGNQIKGVINLGHRPLHSISNIYFDGIKAGLTDYCYNLEGGWMAFNSSAISGVDEIKVEYIYSTDLDLITAKFKMQEGMPTKLTDGRKNKIYLNEGSSLNTTASWETDTANVSTAAAVGDIDKDGDIDLVFAGYVSESPTPIYLHLNQTTQEVMPLEITFGPNAAVIKNLAVINWGTNLSATSKVEYGLDTNYGSMIEDTAYVIEHSLTLDSLVYNTTYHYRVYSKDTSENEVISGDHTFATQKIKPVRLHLPGGGGGVK